MRLPSVLGRFVFGSFFLYNGINHFLQRKQMAQYVDSKHVPMPDAAVAVSGVALSLGGASLVLGVQPKLGAARGGFSVGCISDHARLLARGGSGEAAGEMINFSKNMALLGGSLALMGVDDKEAEKRSRRLFGEKNSDRGLTCSPPCGALSLRKQGLKLSRAISSGLLPRHFCRFNAIR